MSRRVALRSWGTVSPLHKYMLRFRSFNPPSKIICSGWQEHVDRCARSRRAHRVLRRPVAALIQSQLEHRPMGLRCRAQPKVHSPTSRTVLAESERLRDRGPSRDCGHRCMASTSVFAACCKDAGTLTSKLLEPAMIREIPSSLRALRKETSKQRLLPTRLGRLIGRPGCFENPTVPPWLLALCLCSAISWHVLSNPIKAVPRSQI